MMRDLNNNRFEILVKAIKQFEGWEVGHTNLPLRITKVFYTLSEAMKNAGNNPQTKKPSELDSDGDLKVQNGLLSKFPFFLSASVRTLGSMVGDERLELPTLTV